MITKAVRIYVSNKKLKGKIIYIDSLRSIKGRKVTNVASYTPFKDKVKCETISDLGKILYSRIRVDMHLIRKDGSVGRIIKNLRSGDTIITGMCTLIT